MAEPTIKIKRSSVAGKTPSTSNLSLGELGLNTYDGKLFLKQDQGGVGVGTTVITVNPWNVGVGSTAYNTYFTAGNVGIGLTNPTSKLQVQGDVSVSGVVTAVGGFNIGIQSAGLNVVTGVITALNFVGTGNTFNYNSATKTIDISISGSGVGAAGTVFSRTVTDFTATEGQTTFSVSYSVGYVDVYINGVYIDSSEYTATNGTSVILNVGANTGDTVSIITYVTGGTLVSGVSDRTKTLVIAGAGQTEFTVDYISDSYLDVYLNGSKLNGNEYTATNGTTVGLNTGASLNDEVEFIAYNPIYSDALWSASNPGYGSTSAIYRLNSNVGIGTTNPTQKLQVLASESSTFQNSTTPNTGTSSVNITNISGDAKLTLQNDDRVSAGLGTLSNNGSQLVFGGKSSSTNTVTNIAFGAIGAYKENNTSANQQGYLSLYTRPSSGGLAERVRIDSSGSVGIGTTNPGSLLQVQGNTLITGIATVNSNFVVNGNTLVADATNNRVGIGTTNPTSKLTVQGDTNINNTLPSTVSYASSFSVATQETAPQEISFSNDGKTMYVLGSIGDDITWYTLSTPWDITTATYVSEFSVVGQESGPVGLYFKPDGTKFYVLGTSTNDAVYQYSCRNPWDLTTASYDSVSYNVVEDLNPRGVEFKPDGTRMYVVGVANDAIYQYSLSTPWDVSTVSYGSSFNVASQEAEPQGIRFSLDGTKLLLTGGSGDDINYYTLSTPWDITTTSFVGIITAVGAAPFGETIPAGLYWKPDGTRLYLTGNTVDAVWQFNMTSDADLEVTGKTSLYGNLHVYENTTAYGELSAYENAYFYSNVGIGTTNPIEELHLFNNQNEGTVIRVENNNTGTGANASVRLFSDTATLTQLAHGSGRTASRFGTVLGRFGEISLSSGNGFLVGTQNATPLILGTNDTEALRIDSSQKVGIGTTNPSTTLDVGGEITVRRSNTTQEGGQITFTRAIDDVQAYSIDVYNDSGQGTSPRLRFIDNVAGAERVSIDKTGNLLVGSASVSGTASQPLQVNGGAYISGSVGIGTTNPLHQLQINSNTGNCRIRMEGRGMSNSEYTILQVIGYASTQPATPRSAYFGTYKHAGILYPQPFIFLEEQDGGNNYLWMDNSALLRTSQTVTNLGLAAGTVIGDQTSDERMKNVLGEVPYGLEEIKNINPVRYSMKSEPDRERIGFIAQQVQPIVPESVYDTKDLIEDHEDEPTKLAMEYVSLIPVLVNAVKELSAEVEILKSQLESLNT